MSNQQAPQVPPDPGEQGTVASFADLTPAQLYANGIAMLEHAVYRSAGPPEQAADAATAQAFFFAALAAAEPGLAKAGKPEGA